MKAERKTSKSIKDFKIFRETLFICLPVLFSPSLLLSIPFKEALLTGMSNIAILQIYDPFVCCICLSTDCMSVSVHLIFLVCSILSLLLLKSLVISQRHSRYFSISLPLFYPSFLPSRFVSCFHLLFSASVVSSLTILLPLSLHITPILCVLNLMERRQA